MRYMTPDYDYSPKGNLFDEEVEKTREPTGSVTKEELAKAINGFAGSITDIEMFRFFNNVMMSVKTGINVFDSVSFFKRFADAYLFTLKKNFPHISGEKIHELEKLFNQIEKILAIFLKNGNVENKYLLTLSLGMIAGMLDYENY